LPSNGTAQRGQAGLSKGIAQQKQSAAKPRLAKALRRSASRRAAPTAEQRAAKPRTAMALQSCAPRRAAWQWLCNFSLHSCNKSFIHP